MSKLNKASKQIESPELYVGTFPVYVSPKFDGYRVTFEGGQALSYTGKLIPNRYVQHVANKLKDLVEGLDGEITVGSNFQESAEITRINPEKEFVNFTFNCFDDWSNPDQDYMTRYESACTRIAHLHIKYPQFSQHFSPALNSLVTSKEGLVAIYPQIRTSEGCILRSPEAEYQYGKRQSDIIKIKPYAQSEAMIIGFVTEKYGENLKTVASELWGQPKEQISALLVKGVGDFHDRGFKIGTGFSRELKKRMWANQEKFLGTYVTYKYIASGSKDKPRHPVYLGQRDPLDFNTGEVINAA